jgi:hypothetical protein
MTPYFSRIVVGVVEGAAVGHGDASNTWWRNPQHALCRLPCWFVLHGHQHSSCLAFAKLGFAQVGDVGSGVAMLRCVRIFHSPQLFHNWISVFHLKLSKISSGVAITGTLAPNAAKANSILRRGSAPAM